MLESIQQPWIKEACVAGQKAIPGAYDGREQALIKHTLLKSYLQKLFLIVGMAAGKGRRADLCYIDCFAGPWGDDSDGMDSTSIAVSLRVLNACRQTLESLGVSANIRALYIEEDARAFGRLSGYLKASTPSGIQAHALRGDFVALRAEILGWTGTDSFAFFFIDPKGWKDVRIEILRKLLERPRSEFLINFMYDFINRTMSMTEWQPDMKELLGKSIDLAGLAPEQREGAIVRTYRDSLKSCMPSSSARYPARSAYVRVMDPKSNRPKYHLVYLTSHPQGIVEFMKISEQVDLVQKQVRAVKRDAAREEKTGTADMFGAETLVDPNAGHASPQDVDAYWLSYLESGTRAIRRNEFAAILEETNWFPGDLQASLVRLIAGGAVRNLDAQGKRPRIPLHFDEPNGERLQRLPVQI